MIADIIVKAAGMEAEEQGVYYPRPSAAGSDRCLRQLVYWASGTAQDRRTSDRMVLVLDDSSIHETLTEDWLNKTAFQLHSQQMGVNCAVLPFIPPPKEFDRNALRVELNKTGGNVSRAFLGWLLAFGWKYCPICRDAVPLNTIHGHIDGVVTDLTLNDYHYEHKALNHFTFEKLWNGSWPTGYITQCALYNKGIQENLNPEITRTVLLVKNKNTAAYLEYILQYDFLKDRVVVLEMSRSSGERICNDDFSPIFKIENVCANAVERFRVVEGYVEDGTLPDRQYTLSDWQCNYCYWGGSEGTCWQGYEADHNALSTNVVLAERVEELCAQYLRLNVELNGKKVRQGKEWLQVERGVEEEKEALRGQIRAILGRIEAAFADELEEVCRYYLETSTHVTNITAEKEKLQEEFSKILGEERAREARAGSYLIKDALQHRTYTNEDKIPSHILEAAKEKRLVRVLTIRNAAENTKRR